MQPSRNLYKKKFKLSAVTEKRFKYFQNLYTCRYKILSWKSFHQLNYTMYVKLYVIVNLIKLFKPIQYM